jgi:hypothetical protein
VTGGPGADGTGTGAADGDDRSGVVRLPREAVADVAGVDDPTWEVPGPTRRRVEGTWPVELAGITESVVTTLGPNGLWNVAALGLHAPGRGGDGDADASGDGDADASGDGDADASGDGDADAGPVTATTWGRTRTWRNFRERGVGVVQFVTDPRDFVDATLTVREEPTPVLASADAWVQVRAASTGVADADGTRREGWTLTPTTGAVRRERPFTIDRGFAAVVDATVAASRLDVDAYDAATLLERLGYCAETADRCGGPDVRAAMDRLAAVTGWRDRLTE